MKVIIAIFNKIMSDSLEQKSCCLVGEGKKQKKMLSNIACIKK